jgi:hypothetical protein
MPPSSGEVAQTMLRKIRPLLEKAEILQGFGEYGRNSLFAWSDSLDRGGYIPQIWVFSTNPTRTKWEK